MRLRETADAMREGNPREGKDKETDRANDTRTRIEPGAWRKTSQDAGEMEAIREEEGKSLFQAVGPGRMWPDGAGVTFVVFEVHPCRN